MKLKLQIELRQKFNLVNIKKGINIDLPGCLLSYLCVLLNQIMLNIFTFSCQYVARGVYVVLVLMMLVAY